MNVWVDGSAFENNRQHGVWRVFYEIMCRTTEDVQYTLWLRSAPVQPLPPCVKIYRDPGREDVARFNLPRRLARRVSSRRDPAGLLKADLYHPTGFTLPLDHRVTMVMTVYDMIAESHFPIGIRELQEAIPIKQKSLERASRLACISKTTASELERFYPQYRQKTLVVPLGAEHLVTDWLTQPDSRDPRKALFVGQRLGYKNFACLLDAMTTPAWPTNVQLSVVGPPFSDAEVLLIRSRSLSNQIRNLGHLSKEQLRSEYGSARCLICPSLQEGFGLPCLEAQSLGCPLICSDIPVFHEVAGSAALYFDARLGEALAEQVARVGDEAIRKQLRKEGFENIRRFSWDESATRLLQVYQDAISEAN